MGKYAYLIKIDANENNNKFYEMIEQDNGYIELYNGRVESSRVKQKDKSIYEWNKIFNSKIKKGYSDVSDFRSVKTSNIQSKYKDIIDVNINSLITKLQEYAGESVSTNYSIKSAQVTQQMIDEAQSVINDLTNNITNNFDIKYLNSKLEYLYTIIPRKMLKVKDHLLSDSDNIETSQTLLLNEQDILDSMAGQVIQSSSNTISDTNINNDKTILETFNLILEHGDDADYKYIKSYMKDYNNSDASNQLYKVYKAKNTTTEINFNNYLAKQKNKKTTLLWHGSRSSVWWYIYQQGLNIRPAVNGSMLGLGIYFADKYAKSRGYTSHRQSVYTGGNSSEAFLGIFEVHTGDQKIIDKYKSEYSRLDYDKLKKENKDSVFAKGGFDLQNNEYVIYQNEQSTIKYLVWIKT